MSYKSLDIQRKSDVGKIATEIFKNNFHPDNAEMEYVRRDISQYKLMLVSKFMALYGFPTVEHDFDSSNCVVEVHHSKQNHSSELMIHQESDGDFPDSQTLCVYLKNTFSGGGLNIYGSGNDRDFIKTLPTKCSDKDNIACVMFDSEVWHMPQLASLDIDEESKERIMVSFHIRHRNSVV